MGVLYNLIRWIGTIGAESPDVNALILDGNASYALKDYDRAIAAYTEAIRHDPANAHLYHNRGAAWFGKLDYDQALNDFDEALRLDPKSQYAYSGRAAVWTFKEEFDQALADCNTALRLNPDDAMNYASRGSVWYRMQEFVKALEDYSEAIHVDPNSAQAWCGRAAVWLAKAENERTADGAYQLDRPTVSTEDPARRDYHRAIADYGEATRLDPNYADAFLGRGAAWHYLEEYDRALDDFCEAIRLDPGYVHAYVNRGHAWRELQQYRKAIDDFEQARRLDPKDVWSLFGLAWLRATARDAEFRDGKEAVALAHTALMLEPKLLAAAQDTLAVAYAEVGDFATAVAWEEKALVNAPTAFAEDMRKRLELFRNKKPYRQESKRPMVTQFMQVKMR